MPTADLHIRIHYEIDGEGPPLLLLAGMMSDSASWGPLVPLLTPHFTVIRPDNRTTGRTENAAPGLDAWAQDAAALLDHLNLPKAHVAGHSLGGLIATHLAATAPARVDRLALLAAAPVWLPRNTALFRHLIALRDPAYPPDLWLRALFPGSSIPAPSTAPPSSTPWSPSRSPIPTRNPAPRCSPSLTPTRLRKPRSNSPTPSRPRSRSSPRMTS